ncbi:DNA-binding MarR family transcriptional regulator [Kitasatospora sp. MAA19]|uniref:MarR family winged helix-turn-helix transcriptional regulator n=1 Tax=unclassified Kitasatospora TaxID=2633591 RepID=UPI002473656A|nr:MarR family transcriptional regulator [Kitasatospora sp. MAA19]MDH6705863.1 DNA-binding MarR family transcriptional regulator [Kitasatospora sp. MAA19]
MEHHQHQHAQVGTGTPAGSGAHPGVGTQPGPDADHVALIQAAWRRERPDLDVSPLAVIGRLHRLAARLTGELTLVYARYGLSEGEFDVLAALRRAGTPYERAPGELAAHTMVTTGAMTKRIDRLERAGLVTRRHAEDDRRGRVVALTDAGLRLIDEAFTAHVRNEHRLLALLSPEESAALQSLLTTWQHRLDGTRPGAADG